MPWKTVELRAGRCGIWKPRAGETGRVKFGGKGPYTGNINALYIYILKAFLRKKK